MSQTLKKILNDLGNETKRLGTQGAMELASALFSGQGFVPYGPGQYTPSTVPEKETNKAPAQPEIERSGREV